MLPGKLGMSKGGGLAPKDARKSLNPIPDTPRRAHSYATKINTETFQLQQMHPRHTVDTNSPRVLPQVTLGNQGPRKNS